MLYCTAVNYGHKFITHADKEKGAITYYPGNVYAVADNHGLWISRAKAVQVSKSIAQSIVNDQVDKDQAAWDIVNDGIPTPTKRNFKPLDITLP
jgi:hypothetical protein